jgi:DnaK suppressor protein
LESDRNFQLRIKDRERKLIQKIKEALDRIEDRTFGTCESCENDLREKVDGKTHDHPVYRCKTEDEQKERLERLRGTRETPKVPS